jgi:hypothetical protein
VNIISTIKRIQKTALVISAVSMSFSAFGMLKVADRSKQDNVTLGLLAGWTGVSGVSYAASKKLYRMAEWPIRYNKPLLWAARASRGVSYVTIAPLTTLMGIASLYCMVVKPAEAITKKMDRLENRPSCDVFSQNEPKNEPKIELKNESTQNNE